MSSRLANEKNNSIFVNENIPVVSLPISQGVVIWYLVTLLVTHEHSNAIFRFVLCVDFESKFTPIFIDLCMVFLCFIVNLESLRNLSKYRCHLFIKSSADNHLRVVYYRRIYYKYLWYK